MRKNPAIWISLISALLLLAVGFGLKVSDVQVERIMDVAIIVVPLLIGATGVAIRSQVYSPDSVKTALDMPPGASVALLDKVIANSVEVKPGDTIVKVSEKVIEARKGDS